MTTYTDVFGGANIYPSELSYSSLTLTGNVTLSWPEETSASSNLATKIMDISAASSGYVITLPDASKTSSGQTILFNNRGALNITINNAAGTQVVVISSGTLWQIYLADNSTSAGTWRSFQYGSTVSVANASALAGTGIIAVGALLSQSLPITAINANYTAASTDRAKMFNWTGAGGTYTLPSATTAGNNWFLHMRNSGSGAIVATPVGGDTINGASTLSFQPSDSAIIACDGTSFYTIGFGQSAVFAFDYTSVNVAGTGNYTLSGAELNRVSYRFTGALTGNRTIIVPLTVQQYWVDNQTSGAYTLTIAPNGGGTTFNVSAGSRAILYCDGTNVLNASTQGVSLPLTVAQGGTNATTAGNALVNLGGTSLGVSLFTAASSAAAWAALGALPAGSVDGGSF